VGRQADGGGGVGEGVADRLLDPVAGVGAEPGAEGGVEVLGGADQAEVPLADQVVQGDPPAGVVAGEGGKGVMVKKMSGNVNDVGKRTGWASITVPDNFFTLKVANEGFLLLFTRSILQIT
jgi:hypothetical protein